MIGLGQILVILIVIVLLFGNLPKLLRDLAQGIKVFKDTFESDEKKNSRDSNKKVQSEEDIKSDK